MDEKVWISMSVIPEKEQIHLTGFLEASSRAEALRIAKEKSDGHIYNAFQILPTRHFMELGNEIGRWLYESGVPEDKVTEAVREVAQTILDMHDDTKDESVE